MNVPFQGYLDRWAFKGSTLEIRLSSGNFEDKPKAAVLYVVVDAPLDAKAAGRRLSLVQPHDTEIFVPDPSATEVILQLDYGDPIVLRGERVHVRQTDLEAEDYARLARLHHQSADLASESLASLNQRVIGAKHLLEDQMHRIAEKAKGHKAGSVARTLYDQQLSFISRVIRKLDG